MIDDESAGAPPAERPQHRMDGVAVSDRQIRYLRILLDLHHRDEADLLAEHHIRELSDLNKRTATRIIKRLLQPSRARTVSR